MNMAVKVTKFGGSSLASAEQILKMKQIVEADEARKFVVPSAPGKRFKDDVKEVVVGQDCGLNIESFNDIRVGDVIEGYEQVEVKRN